MSAETRTTEDAPDRPGRAQSISSTWALFCDWCAATEQSALPADPATLIRFLDAHPSTTSTRRRRVADIDSVHRRSGLAEPGHTVTIRLALVERRRERTARARAAAAALISQIPMNGWPHGLFGRRDAMILTLVASGMTPTEITGLRRGDIVVANSDLIVSYDHRISRDLFGDRPGHEPVAIYRRWVQVQSLLDRPATSRTMADALAPNYMPAAHGCALVDAVSTAHADEPLLVRIDRWGHTPWAPEPLTSKSASTLIRAHLTGQPPTHCRPSTEPGAGHSTKNVLPAPCSEDDIVLGAGYYADGIAARWRARGQLSDVGAEFDEIDARIDALQCRIHDIADVVAGALNREEILIRSDGDWRSATESPPRT